VRAWAALDDAALFQVMLAWEAPKRKLDVLKTTGIHELPLVDIGRLVQVYREAQAERQGRPRRPRRPKTVQ
jgi:hypothetical protein